ncbi:MAG TPA: hypothetical protein VH540_15085 [Ktedonobacterales bacterium]|jgi:hypothetical protein
MGNVTLDPAEVVCTTSGSRQSGRSKARYSRANDLYSAEMRLKHTPTGTEVSGSIPPGNYSRKEQHLLHEKLYNDLFHALEQAVARAKRLPGQ